MRSRCVSCLDEYEVKPGSDEFQCPECVANELDLLYDTVDAYYPLTRREQLRERLGVSGDVDE